MNQTELEYRSGEIMRHLLKLDSFKSEPLSERREAAEELFDALRNWKNSEGKDDYLIERVAGWAYNGTFGEGIYYRFRDAVGWQPRTKAVMLMREAACLNFLIDEGTFNRTFKKALPDKADREKFNAAVIAEMESQDKGSES